MVGRGGDAAVFLASGDRFEEDAGFGLILAGKVMLPNCKRVSDLTEPPDLRALLSRIERLWRSLKYEWVYLNAFETGSEVRRGIGAWLSYYNEKRPHSSHGPLTPAEACDTQDPNLKAAA